MIYIQIVHLHLDFWSSAHDSIENRDDHQIGDSHGLYLKWEVA